MMKKAFYLTALSFVGHTAEAYVSQTDDNCRVLYVGGNLGYNQNMAKINTVSEGTMAADRSELGSQSFAGGAQLGAAFRIGQRFNLGLEGRYVGLSATGQKETSGQLGGYTLGHKFTVKNIWDISALWGFHIRPETLVYLRTGVAFGALTLKTYGDWGVGTTHKGGTGFMGGLGMRHHFSWCYVGAEWSLTTFNGVSQLPVNDFGVITHTVKANPQISQLFLITFGVPWSF